jgi:hypothetical protein
MTLRASLPAVAALLAAGVVMLAGCGDGNGNGAAGGPGGDTPMDAVAAESYLRFTGTGLRGRPANMRFARDTPKQDMSLSEDGATRWSVTGGVPVRFRNDRPECRYPAVSEAQFADIASQVLWSERPPADFPATGDWGFLGTRQDADAGSQDGSTWRYTSGGEVVLRLDPKGRPLSATTDRGPFTLDYGRWEVTTVRDAGSLPACT